MLETSKIRAATLVVLLGMFKSKKYTIANCQRLSTIFACLARGVDNQDRRQARRTCNIRLSRCFCPWACDDLQICVDEEVRPVTTVLSVDFIYVINVHGWDRREDERHCPLRPPIYPVEIASASRQKAGEKGGLGDRSRVVACRRRREQSIEGGGGTRGTRTQGPTSRYRRDGGAADAAGNSRVHASWLKKVDCRWEWLRVPVLERVGDGAY